MQRERCLEEIVSGFEQLRASCAQPPSAISFAFPGPANYSEGIIQPLANLPAFDRPVALGPMLEEHFGIPVFINNDGDLFAYGEARAGFLPHINDLLARHDPTRRCRNLVGLTLGTGLGCGVYLDGRMLGGDNDAAAEIWSVVDHRFSGEPVEETISVRGLRRMYAAQADVPLEHVPQPRELFSLRTGPDVRAREAATHAFTQYYDALAEVVLTCIALFDGIVVLGGGIAGSAAAFLPEMERKLNTESALRDGRRIHRLESTVYNLSDPDRLQAWLQPRRETLRIPRSESTVLFSPEKRSGLALATGGTSASIMKGAYYYAVDRLQAAAPAYT
jgi:glucokinase